MVISEDNIIERGFRLLPQCKGVYDKFFLIDICDDKYHLELSQLSNMVGRDWNIHIDNCDYQTIGSCAVQTYEHINAFLKVLDIDYEF